MKMAGIVISGLVLLAALSLLHLVSGARLVSPSIVMAALFDHDPRNYLHVVVVKQRLTRLAVAIAIGAMLAVSGYALQKVLRNDLVSPSTLGINSGAAAFSVAGIYFFGLGGTSLVLPALIGALTALGFAFLAADLLGRGSRDPINLVLGGAMSGTLFSTATAFIVSLDPDVFGKILGWMVGDIGIFDYQALIPLWPVALVFIGAVFVFLRPLDLMAVGGEQAQSLGVDVRLVQRLLVASAIVLSVIAVTVVGPIGFVGLVVPHLARLLVGETGAAPLVACIFLGSGLVTVADILARTIAAPQLLNVGTVMALFGGVAFLAIVLAVLRRRAT